MGLNLVYKFMYKVNSLTTESGRKDKILTIFEIIWPHKIWFA